MKKKNVKRLTAIIISIFIIMSVLPLAAFAEDKTMDNINITVKKPTVNAEFAGKEQDYAAKLDKDSGLEIVKASWLRLENKKGHATAKFEKFEGENTYFLSIYFKVKDGYKLCDDESKIKVNMNFTNAQKEMPKFVPFDKYKYKDATYTVEADDAGSETYLKFMYSVEMNLIPTQELKIKTKAPVTDVQYSKDDKLLPEFKPVIEAGHGFKAGESMWLNLSESGDGAITQTFEAGSNYLLSVGVFVDDGYKVPDNMKDIPITIDFDGGEKITLKAKDYRDPSDFDGKETNTYTIHVIKENGKVTAFDFIYSVKPLEAVIDDVILYYTKPVIGDKWAGGDDKYFIEADSADGINANGILWEKKVIGNIYRNFDKFEEGGQYRFTLYLNVYDGYKLPENLYDMKITLIDETNEKTVLQNKDYKIEYHYAGDKIIGCTLIYELPYKLTETKKPGDVTDTTAQGETQSKPDDKENDDVMSPDTGAKAGGAILLLAAAGIGLGFVAGKRRKDKVI